MPKRTKRSAKAEPERPSTGALALAVLMHYPRQSVATAMAMLAVGTIVSNALFMQAGQHPAPIFGRKPQGVTVQVAEPSAPRPRIIAPAPVQPVVAPAPVASVPVPVPAPSPAAAPRNRGDIITDLQRELSHKGFYDGAVDGIWGARTDMALRDFATAAGIRALWLNRHGLAHPDPAIAMQISCLHPAEDVAMLVAPDHALFERFADGANA